MRLQVTGYDFVKNGDLTIIHAIDLTTPSKNGAGYRPFFTQRNSVTREGLWVNKSLGFVVNKELLNKVINVEFNANGYIVSIQVEK